MPIVTRTSSEPEPLEGGEFTRVRLEASHSESDFIETVRRLRHARSAFNIAKQLGRLLGEVPPP